MIGGVNLHRHRAIQFAAAAMLVAAAAVILGWRAGHRAAAHQVAAATTPWALPQEQRSDAEADAATLRARRPWGGGAAFRDIDGSPPPPPPVAATPPWHLVGTVLREDGRFALIEIGPRPAGKLEYRGIGEQLPDHSVVLQIEFDSITAKGGAGMPSGPIVYRLFQKKS